jgi:AbrB family looped-hinge helix DNA binding protein
MKIEKTTKATGIVRRIDDLGRVIIPKEIRRTLGIRVGDPLEISLDKEGEVILIRRRIAEWRAVMPGNAPGESRPVTSPEKGELRWK